MSEPKKCKYCAGTGKHPSPSKKDIQEDNNKCPFCWGSGICRDSKKK